MRSPWNKQTRILPVLFVVALLVVLAGCSTPQSILAPYSPAATEVANLFLIVFWVAVGIFILVEGLLVFFVIRYQRRASSETPEQIHGNTKLEVTWTVIPALILIVVFALTIRTMGQAGPTNPPAQGIPIQVVGHQWWWEIRYPNEKVVTATDLHLPTGQVANIELTSENVIHSFWVPSLMGKTDLIPGHTNKSWLLTDVPGVYFGQCAEFCGEQHANMRFRVIAQSPAEFQEWIKSQQQVPPEPPAGSLEARGKEIFLNPQYLCIGCHAIDGTNAVGITGPNLTHFASRDCFAGCMRPNTPDELTKWLENPQAVKPGTIMKINPLTPEEIQALVAYLESLK